MTSHICVSNVKENERSPEILSMFDLLPSHSSWVNALRWIGDLSRVRFLPLALSALGSISADPRDTIREWSGSKDEWMNEWMNLSEWNEDSCLKKGNIIVRFLSEICDNLCIEAIQISEDSTCKSKSYTLICLSWGGRFVLSTFVVYYSLCFLFLVVFFSQCT